MTGLTEMVYACAYIAFDFGNASWLVLFTYCGVILSLIELLSWGLMLVMEHTPSGIIVEGGPALHTRNWVDIAYIVANKLQTVMFTHHLLSYCAASGHVHWRLEYLSVWNGCLVIPVLFVLYDLFYSLFHRALHIPALYPYIHKHHHRQVAPMRGHDDAVNTHPFEFFVGEYIHLVAVALVPSVHVIAVILFIATGGVLASLNHTRFDVSLGWFFSVREHDTHHKIPNSNYGQYVQVWDRLLGTYREWVSPQSKQSPGGGVRRPIVPEMSTEHACATARARVFKAPYAGSYAVTGANGLVGHCIVKMLLQRGADRVVAVDLSFTKEDMGNDSRVELVTADIRSVDALMKAFKGVDAVFHTAALVGPYFKRDQYDAVNHQGAVNVVDACKACKVRRLVMTGSPTTRMDGSDVCGLSEEELPRHPKRYLQEYARSKAMGQDAVLAASGTDGLLSTVVAPHQVYGEEDALFIPAFIENARAGRLRIIGDGQNLISFTHVENIAHAHLLAAEKLTTTGVAPAGEFYVITDGGARYLWDAIDQITREIGCDTSLWYKFHVSYDVLYYIAWILEIIGMALGRPISKLSRFAVRMMNVHRYFNIDKACRDLNYTPIKSFETGWPEAIRSCAQRV